MIGPDFFVIGAPKCGTTSLDGYLGAHPEVFMARKEQHFFGEDLGEIWLRPGQRVLRPDRETYMGMFAGAERARRRGETSVWYLYSRSVPHEIHEYRPDARIIVLLRNPVDMLASLHSQLLFDRIEDIRSFPEALAAEGDRRAGRRIPPNNSPEPWRLYYRELGRFYEHLLPYTSVFGAERVHVLLQEDMTQDPAGTYRRVLEFLGVDPSFTPSFTVANANKRIRSAGLQRLVWQIGDENSRLRKIGTAAIPVHRLRSALLARGVPALKQFNRVVEKREPIDPDLRRTLAAEFADDIADLGRLIGRDLRHWLHDDAGSQAAPLAPLRGE